MKNKLLTIFILGMFLFSVTSVLALDEQGTGKQGQNFTIVQTCDDATYVTIDGILLPDKTYKVINQNMTLIGSGTFLYNFTETSQVGRYDVSQISDGCEKTFAYYFEISPSGMDSNDSQGWSLIGSLVIMIIVSLVFLLIAFKTESVGAKVTFFAISGVVFIMSILYTVVIMQQTLFGFDSILSGIETFWFVMKMLVGIGILALLIIVVLILIKAWKIKRGYRDE